MLARLGQLSPIPKSPSWPSFFLNLIDTKLVWPLFRSFQMARLSFSRGIAQLSKHASRKWKHRRAAKLACHWAAKFAQMRKKDCCWPADGRLPERLVAILPFGLVPERETANHVKEWAAESCLDH